MTTTGTFSSLGLGLREQQQMSSSSDELEKKIQKFSNFLSKIFKIISVRKSLLAFSVFCFIIINTMTDKQMPTVCLSPGKRRTIVCHHWLQFNTKYILSQWLAVTDDNDVGGGSGDGAGLLGMAWNVGMSLVDIHLCKLLPLTVHNGFQNLQSKHAIHTCGARLCFNLILADLIFCG